MKCREVRSPESHVIGEGQRVERRNTSETNQKRVIGQGEEEGGERATLFNPPLDEYPDVGGTPQDRIDPRAREKGTDNSNQPVRETDHRKKLQNVVMVYRIEGFFRIDKKSMEVS